MHEIGWGKHTLVFVAVVINLWVGGDYIEAWFGHYARAGFEMLLILGWLTLIVGMRAPLPWRHPKDGEPDAPAESSRER